MSTGRTALRFSRRLGEQVPCAEYANAIEPPEPKRRLSEIVFGLCIAAIVIAFCIVLAITKGPAP